VYTSRNQLQERSLAQRRDWVRAANHCQPGHLGLRKQSLPVANEKQWEGSVASKWALEAFLCTNLPAAEKNNYGQQGKDTARRIENSRAIQPNIHQLHKSRKLHRLVEARLKLVQGVFNDVSLPALDSYRRPEGLRAGRSVIIAGTHDVRLVACHELPQRASVTSLNGYKCH
jgi:hypothetical protein